jgi:hypothetical protein
MVACCGECGTGCAQDLSLTPPLARSPHIVFPPSFCHFWAGTGRCTSANAPATALLAGALLTRGKFYFEVTVKYAAPAPGTASTTTRSKAVTGATRLSGKQTQYTDKRAGRSGYEAERWWAKPSLPCSKDCWCTSLNVCVLPLRQVPRPAPCGRRLGGSAVRGHVLSGATGWLLRGQ